MRNICHDEIDRAMVKSINQVGHVMVIRTIAEFVEEEKTLNLLKQLGVDYAQGFVIARPQPLETISDQLHVLSKQGVSH